MKFSAVQHFDAPRSEVLDAFRSESLYRAIEPTSKLSAPELLDITQSDGVTVIRVRYKLIAQLPPAALLVVDPNKLTWIEHTTMDEMGSCNIRFEPDHYDRKFDGKAAGHFIDQDNGCCTREVEGDFRIKVLIGAANVERVIVGDLASHLDEQTTAINRYLASTDTSN